MDIIQCVKTPRGTRPNRVEFRKDSFQIELPACQLDAFTYFQPALSKLQHHHCWHTQAQIPTYFLIISPHLAQSQLAWRLILRNALELCCFPHYENMPSIFLLKATLYDLLNHCTVETSIPLTISYGAVNVFLINRKRLDWYSIVAGSIGRRIALTCLIFIAIMLYRLW